MLVRCFFFFERGTISSPRQSITKPRSAHPAVRPYARIQSTTAQLSTRNVVQFLQPLLLSAHVLSKTVEEISFFSHHHPPPPTSLPPSPSRSPSWGWLVWGGFYCRVCQTLANWMRVDRRARKSRLGSRAHIHLLTRAVICSLVNWISVFHGWSSGVPRSSGLTIFRIFLSTFGQGAVPEFVGHPAEGLKATIQNKVQNQVS